MLPASFHNQDLFPDGAAFAKAFDGNGQSVIGLKTPAFIPACRRALHAPRQSWPRFRIHEKVFGIRGLVSSKRVSFSSIMRYLA